VREFLHVDDMAAALVFVMKLVLETYQKETTPMLSHINVGRGVDYTIRELVETFAKVVGYTGDIEFDSSKPDGSSRKLMDVSRPIKLGWEAQVDLETGLAKTYEWFLQHQDDCRA